MDQYPTIRLLVERGDAVALVIAALPIVGGIALFALIPLHWSMLVVGVVASLVLLLIMKSYVELVRVIADMLLPK
jgi:hypothetical protein